MAGLFPLLKSLLAVPGLSGREGAAARLIADHWRSLADEVDLGRLGSVHALKRGVADAPRPSVLLAAHMDTIGLMVSGIQDGFLRLTPIGGVDARILPGQAVIVHATGNDRQQDLPGLLAALPGTQAEALDFAHLCLDLGLPASQVAESVLVGDLVSFGTEAVQMSGETVSGAGLDNRASIAAVTLCLQELRSRSHAWDVWAVATVQEEVTGSGAAASAFQMRPGLAIAIDTTFGKGPGADDWNTFSLGKGPTLGYGPNIHPALYRRFKALATQLDLPCATEFMPSSSGTDGMAMQVAAEGVPTFVLSIPIRNMHTPVEMACLTDIQCAGRLLAEFVAGLERDFLETLSWDETGEM
jgi:putative aminopeptidase FrvX